jgi:endoglucanase
MSADPDPSPIGKLIGGKYRIIRLLARGGMGVVYEAQHTVVRRRFAIKFLRRDLAERRDILNRFQREAEAAGALENDHVTAAIDFSISDDGTPYIVMEYLVGESLAALLEREGRLPVGRAADLVCQACRGVGAAHAAGIVHRDLKPHNLFVCRRDDGTDFVKVLDFGVAKLQAVDEMSAATRTGVVLGTAAYMSPEQARGDKLVDKRADVYALGAILYELVSLRRPHPGDSQNAILHHIATQPPVLLGSVEADLPADFVELVGRAISSDPAARPASVEELGDALAGFARRKVWPAPPSDSGGVRVGELSSTMQAEGGGSSRGTPAAPTADDRAPRPAGPSAGGHLSRPVTPSAGGLALHRPTPSAGARASQPAAPSAGGLSASTSPPAGRRSRVGIGAGATLALVTFAVAAGLLRRGGAPPPPVPVPRRVTTGHVLTAETRFLNAEPAPGAVQQIEGLLKARALRDAALVNAMVATPSSIWLLGGAPQDAENAARDAATRGARQGRVPVFVAYDLPFHDCTGYGAGGAADGAAYRAWIDGVASGIGNEKAVVVLEPNSLGLIPYGIRLDGRKDACTPSVADAEGKRSAPPGASPAERYSLIGYALDRLTTKAPNAAVYLDGTHSSWLPVGDIAFRLKQAGIERAAGFFLNAGNYQPTPRLIQYGTWIAKCLHHARGSAGNDANAYRECASPPDWADSNDDAVWSKAEAWYTENVDRAAQGTSPETLAHFVINTNRNGLGPLAAARYAGPPFNQPSAVVEVLRNGGWCMPPGRGVGLRPTADTKVPLVDAYLWTDLPGMSFASCDIAGGARAWDYSKYNPWGITGDAQNHFDPLWGMVLPPTGAWFPEEALQLARNANPPLEEVGAPETTVLEGESGGMRGPPPIGTAIAPSSLIDAEPKAHVDRAVVANRAAPADARPELSGRPGGKPVGRPSSHAARRSAGAASATEVSSSPPKPVDTEKTGGTPPAFDSDNPYR